MSELFGIVWAYPRALIFFPLLGVCLLLLVQRIRKGYAIVSSLVAAQWQSTLLQHYSTARLWVKALLLGTGLLFLFLTLLHPQWGKKEEKVAQQGRDLFIALDISRSMLAQDLKPNRLTVAKEKIKQLVESLSCERVSLLLFAGTAFVQCPLTSDYAAFFMFLDAVDAQTISSGTTAIDEVIRKTIHMLHAAPSKKNKLLVVVTDGEDFSSNLADLKQKAHELNLHIFTMGVGTAQGAPVPVIDDMGKQRGMQKDEKGNVVISKLNEGILHVLAHDTGGQYIRMTPDDGDVQRLVSLVEAYEKERLEDKDVSRFEEQYPSFAAVSFICFAVEWML